MNITADGTYKLTEGKESSEGMVYISGDLGAATLVLSHGGTELTDGDLEVDTQYHVTHGRLNQLDLVVTSADGSTDFDVDYFIGN